MQGSNIRIWGQKPQVKWDGLNPVVSLRTNKSMRIDERGLVYGGVTFSLADYADFLAVRRRHPLSFLWKASVEYVAPVRVGQLMVAGGTITRDTGKVCTVKVGIRTDRKVFDGVFSNVVLRRHVLDR